jgi:hypothetical protein
VCIYIYVYVYIYACTYTYVHVYTCIYAYISINGLVATGGEETQGAAPTEATQAICARNSGISASGDFNPGSASIPFGLQEAGVPRITRCIHFFFQVVVRVPTGGDDRQETYIIEDDSKLLKKRMSRITFVVRR